MKTRNNQIVGRNSASYNDKHQENPVVLRPIGSALRRNKKSPLTCRAIKCLANYPRQKIILMLKAMNV